MDRSPCLVFPELMGTMAQYIINSSGRNNTTYVGRDEWILYDII